MYVRFCKLVDACGSLVFGHRRTKPQRSAENGTIRESLVVAQMRRRPQPKFYRAVLRHAGLESLLCRT